MRSCSEILQDICAHPQSDLLRLEYADACEAKDPSYAAYIRQEIKLFQPGSGEWERGDEKTAIRIGHPFLEDCYDVQLYRGFVEEVTMDPLVFIDRGDRLLDRAPIRKITFTPKPLPLGVEGPLIRQRVPSLVPEIMASPHLARVRSIAFCNSKFQCWFTQASDLESILTCPYLDQMLTFALAPSRFIPEVEPEYLASVWERAFERPEFRKMICVGFFGYPGERAQTRNEDFTTIIEAMSMPEQGRAHERKHGYLPSLHVSNFWGNLNSTGYSFDHDIVLDVLRGKLPVYPVGTPVTEEMYALPPPKRSTNGSYDW